MMGSMCVYVCYHGDRYIYHRYMRIHSLYMYMYNYNVRYSKFTPHYLHVRVV